MKSNFSVKVKLSIVIFKEDNTFIAYCPALDLSGYGVTEKGAKESFSVVLDEYLNYTLKKKTLFSDLERLGWKSDSKKKKAITPPDFLESIKQNRELGELMNYPSFKKQLIPVTIPFF